MTDTHKLRFPSGVKIEPNHWYRLTVDLHVNADGTSWQDIACYDMTDLTNPIVREKTKPTVQ